MKNLVLLLSIILLAGCQSESIEENLLESSDLEDYDFNLHKSKSKLIICHYDSTNDEWNLINVSNKAWKGHEKHGDIRLDDQDGDTFVPFNECRYGNQGDCDDNNANINPLSNELCDNGIDDNCDGFIDDKDQTCSLIPEIEVASNLEFDSQSSNCTAIVNIPFSIKNICTNNLESFKISFDENNNGSIDRIFDISMVENNCPDFSFTETFPIGSHRFIIEASNNNGSDLDEVLFEVIDAKAPSPICINGLSITLLPQPPNTDADGDGDFDKGAMTIHAGDFIASPISDCSGPITYSINLSGSTPERENTSLVFTCDNNSTELVEIHAWDTAGNNDFCETYVLIQDSMNICN